MVRHIALTTDIFGQLLIGDDEVDDRFSIILCNIFCFIYTSHWFLFWGWMVTLFLIFWFWFWFWDLFKDLLRRILICAFLERCNKVARFFPAQIGAKVVVIAAETVFLLLDFNFNGILDRDLPVGASLSLYGRWVALPSWFAEHDLDLSQSSECSHKNFLNR